MKKRCLQRSLKLTLPAKNMIERGTFKAENLLVNKDGVRVLSEPESEVEASPPIRALDNQVKLTDIVTIKVIGKGNGGIVQLVQHKWTNQFFALKEIILNKEEHLHKQIAQELQINKSTKCPYVVVCYQCYRSFYVRDVISIILEYMDGGSLEDFLNQVQRIPEPNLAAICKQVLQGLIYLHHEKHIIHRDLKPSNLLINHRGEVKISDFGVSAIMDTTSGQANTLVGTYVYMSPERINAKQLGYNYKSDIWSLGLILLQCATGQFPYAPPDQKKGWDNPFQIMEAIVEKPPPSAPCDQFSPEFCSFISSCLQINPRDRPSAKDLVRHPFINKYEDLHVDLSAYFSNAGSPLATI